MSLRMLARASLLLFAVVLLILVVASIGGGDSPSIRSDSSGRGKEKTQSRTRPINEAPLSTRRFYSVKPGDTLGGIAAKTGVQIDQLMSLNPSIDPRALVTGQRIKLRE